MERGFEGDSGTAMERSQGFVKAVGGGGYWRSQMRLGLVLGCGNASGAESGPGFFWGGNPSPPFQALRWRLDATASCAMARPSTSFPPPSGFPDDYAEAMATPQPQGEEEVASSLRSSGCFPLMADRPYMDASLLPSLFESTESSQSFRNALTPTQQVGVPSCGPCDGDGGGGWGQDRCGAVGVGGGAAAR